VGNGTAKGAVTRAPFVEFLLRDNAVARPWNRLQARDLDIATGQLADAVAVFLDAKESSVDFVDNVHLAAHEIERQLAIELVCALVGHVATKATEASARITGTARITATQKGDLAGVTLTRGQEQGFEIFELLFG